MREEKLYSKQILAAPLALCRDSREAAYNLYILLESLMYLAGQSLRSLFL
jgi:hypothetical protein